MSELTSVAALMGFAPGAIGGVCNVFVGHPMDLVKVRIQTAASAKAAALQKKVTMLGELRTIFRTEGVSGLYRGVSAPLLAVTPAFAISFWSFDVGKRLIRQVSTSSSNQEEQQEEEPHLSIAQIGLAGGFSGVPLAAVVGPSERIKCLMQVDGSRYRSFGDCARQLYQTGGVRSLVRGSGATMLRDVPGNAAYFAMYEWSRRELCWLEGTEAPSLLATLMAGGLAGVANWIVAIPFDTLKSRMQTAPEGRYRNLLDVLRALVRQEGAAALFRGLSPALIRAFPANAACLAGVETARSCFGTS